MKMFLLVDIIYYVLLDDDIIFDLGLVVVESCSIIYELVIWIIGVKLIVMLCLMYLVVYSVEFLFVYWGYMNSYIDEYIVFFILWDIIGN